MALNHERYMRRAIELAGRVPDRPFGAVIVDRDTGHVVAEGWNRSDENPMWHGEVDAINHLVATFGTDHGRRLALYTTAEPCPMCQGAILWTGIDVVVFGTSIRFLIGLGWKQIDVPADELVRRGWPCDVIGGVLATECNSLFVDVGR